ncbi:MAG: DUF4293 domain-containing protein [Bacteroidales bacterium]|nr:DUF4293 domain-containing protein [Bacteroidales bacterium]MDD5987915.1 DUF4293 domain-containing protein [Bacteroidales bacterium]
MIQRIQSIYLLLAGIFAALAFATPCALFTSAQPDATCTLYGCHYVTSPATEELFSYPFGVTLMTALCMALPLIIIFGYKNRKRQINHVNLAMLLAVAWYAVCAAYCFAAASRTGFEVAPSYGLVFPALSLLALYLAKRGIKHDEALVRAADRIR